MSPSLLSRAAARAKQRVDVAAVDVVSAVGMWDDVRRRGGPTAEWVEAIGLATAAFRRAEDRWLRIALGLRLAQRRAQWVAPVAP